MKCCSTGTRCGNCSPPGCWEAVHSSAFPERLARDQVCRCRASCVSGYCANTSSSRWRTGNSCISGRRVRQADLTAPAGKLSGALAQLKGIGEVGASCLSLELLWKQFNNGLRAVPAQGSCHSPTTAARASPTKDQQRGNRRVRALPVGLAIARHLCPPNWNMWLCGNRNSASMSFRNN
jgi:transposase